MLSLQAEAAERVRDAQREEREARARWFRALIQKRSARYALVMAYESDWRDIPVEYWRPEVL